MCDERLLQQPRKRGSGRVVVRIVRRDDGVDGRGV
jgi:hypothetical protein